MEQRSVGPVIVGVDGGNLGPVTPWRYEPGAAQAETAAQMLALIEASRDAGLLVVGSRGATPTSPSLSFADRPQGASDAHA
jgi:hypothetical protein